MEMHNIKVKHLNLDSHHIEAAVAIVNTSRLTKARNEKEKKSTQKNKRTKAEKQTQSVTGETPFSHQNHTQTENSQQPKQRHTNVQILA